MKEELSQEKLASSGLAPKQITSLKSLGLKALALWTLLFPPHDSFPHIEFFRSSHSVGNGLYAAALSFELSGGALFEGSVVGHISADYNTNSGNLTTSTFSGFVQRESNSGVAIRLDTTNSSSNSNSSLRLIPIKR